MHAVFSLTLQDEGREQRRREAACTGSAQDDSNDPADLSATYPSQPTDVGPTTIDTSTSRPGSGSSTRESILKTVEDVIMRIDRAPRNATRVSKRQARRRNRVKQGNLLF